MKLRRSSQCKESLGYCTSMTRCSVTRHARRRTEPNLRDITRSSAPPEANCNTEDAELRPEGENLEIIGAEEPEKQPEQGPRALLSLDACVAMQ